MLKTAYVFPGQGAQKVGMGKDFYTYSPTARHIFDLTDDVLDYKLSRLCFEGPADELTLTKNAQPAIFVTSYAFFQASRAAGVLPEPSYMAGHSLGQYTALTEAGALSFQDALRIVATRASLMEEAGRQNPGVMIALIGADLNFAEDICRKTGVEISNINAPGQIIVAGKAHLKDAVIEYSNKSGICKAVPLKVSGAFHTSLMADAASAFKEKLRQTPISNATVPLISNVTASPIYTQDEICQELEEQLIRPVRWQETVEYLGSQGVNTFIEFGPGNVLTGLIKRTLPNAMLYNVSSIDDLEQDFRG
ncbi:MAG: ACP S-malonyltransferase [Dehalococcoidales bacterium]|nr:ACP S-malonyltransferase [Dehalococcoidales bacterium]